LQNAPNLTEAKAVQVTNPIEVESMEYDETGAQDGENI
jgi:hypothetical protein